MPWATALPLLVLLPFALSGAVRFSAGWSFGASLALAWAPCGLLLALSLFYGLPRIAASAGELAAPLTLAGALISTWFFYRLWWTPLFDGMPNTFHGVDIGNHLLLYQRFLHIDHKQYEGFVGLYALMHWYRKIFARGVSEPASIFLALRFCTYAFQLALPVAMALIVWPVIASCERRRDELKAFVLSLPVQLLVVGYLIFPTLQYFQAEGFYSQLAGVFPLLFGWLSYGLLETPSTRFFACCAWLVVQRFTYGLNMADVLVTLSWLWLWDARFIAQRWLRVAAWLFVPVALYAAKLILGRLYPLRIMQGYFMDQRIAWILGCQLLLSIALLSAAALFEASGIAVAHASKRLWRYAGLVALINAVLTAIYLAYDEPLKYYILKYGMYAMLLAALAVIGPLATLLVHVASSPLRWWSSPGHGRLAAGSVLVLVLVSFGILHGYEPYRALARERAERTPPVYDALPELQSGMRRWPTHFTLPESTYYSAYEPEIEHFIDATLWRTQKPFGGYYDFFWPRMFTHNSLYFLFSHLPDYHFNGAYNASRGLFSDPPGRCYFVLGHPDQYHAPAESELGVQLRKFYDARSSCSAFRPPWSAVELTICAACL